MRNKLLILLAASLGTLVGVAHGADDGFQRERKPSNQEAKDGLEGKAPPALRVEGWLNTDDKPIDLKQLQGKVVLIDFWGVWCPPCRRAIPHLKELYTKHKDDGLVVIGIHTTNQGEKMAEFAQQEMIPYPLAVDVNNETVEAFHVDSFPDYYLIDRRGELRFADLANPEVDRAVAKLLAEE